MPIYLQTSVITISHYIVYICQILAIIVISTGIIKAMIIFVQNIFSQVDNLNTTIKTRMELGASFSFGLSILIGSSILKTTIAPTWNDIGQLSAIIGIRTILNFFLLLEMDKYSIQSKKT